MRLLRNIHTNSRTFSLRGPLVAATALTLALGSASVSAQQYIAERLLDPAEVERITGTAEDSAKQDKDQTAEQPQQERERETGDQDQTSAIFRGTTDTII